MRVGVVVGLVMLFAVATAWATEYDLGNPATADLTVLGPELDAEIGYAVATGDLDGDGAPDVALGAPGFGAGSFSSRLGAVYLLLSSAGYLGATIDLADQSADGRVRGEADNFAGYAVATGDLDGDGIDDLVVGAARAEGPDGEAVAGAVFVFYGRASWPDSLTVADDADATIWGEKADGQLGARVATGDFDGDGTADLFAAAPGFQGVGAPAAGKAYGFLGGTIEGVIDLRGTTDQADIEIVGEMSGERLGLGLALGDLDGDGYDDLALGAPGLSPPLPGGKESFPGYVYVIRGRTLAATLQIDLASDTPDVRLTLADQTGNLGAALAVGDLNGDDLGDLAIGAPNLPTKQSAAGEVFVVWGQAAWPGTIDLATADMTIRGVAADDRFGFALAVGDASGDCRADLAIGAPRFGALGTSHAYIIQGGSDYPQQVEIDLANGDEPLHTYLGAAARDETGFALALSDLDGDGAADLLLGAPAGDVLPLRLDCGAVYAVLSDAVNQPPMADAGPDRKTIVNVPVVLDGRDSDDPEGAALTYAWTQVSGPAAATVFDGDTATPLVVPTAAGSYIFSLTVADCNASGEPDSVIVTAENLSDDDDDDDDVADDDAADDDAADDDAADDDATDDDTADDDAADDDAADDDDNGVFGSSKDDDVGVYGGGGCTG